VGPITDARPHALTLTPPKCPNIDLVPIPGEYRCYSRRADG
jgi:hypothetical protein